jgi:hypothetical protein
MRYNREDSGFATYTLKNIHHYGKTEDIIEHMDTSERAK